MTGQDLQRRRVALGLSTDDLGRFLDEHSQQVEAWEHTSGSLAASLSRRLEWVLATHEREAQLVAAGHTPCELAKQAFGEPTPGDLPAFQAAAKRVDEHAATCPQCQGREAFLATLPPLPDPPFSIPLRVFAAVIGVAERLPPMLRPAVYGACLLGAMTIIRGVIMLAVSPKSITPQTALLLMGAIGIGAYGGAVGGVTYGWVRPRTRRFGRIGDYLTGLACAYAYLLAFLLPLALLGKKSDLWTATGGGIFPVFGTLFGLLIGHFWFRNDPGQTGV